MDAGGETPNFLTQALGTLSCFSSWFEEITHALRAKLIFDILFFERFLEKIYFYDISNDASVNDTNLNRNDKNEWKA
jgi:hypothetical protein